MMISFNIKAKKEHFVLEEAIKTLDTHVDMTRSALLFRMIDEGLKVDDWEEIRVKLFAFKTKMAEPKNTFVTFQAKLDKENNDKLTQIRKNILNDIKDLKVLQNQYLLQLLMKNYLSVLRKNKLKVGNKDVKCEFNGPDMASILFEMMLSDRGSEYLDDIKDIMIKWVKENEK